MIKNLSNPRFMVQLGASRLPLDATRLGRLVSYTIGRRRNLPANFYSVSFKGI